MADTTLGDWPDETCDDCGKQGTSYHHWGYLTEGPLKKLCGKCMSIRDQKSRGIPFCDHGKSMGEACADCQRGNGGAIC